ncbi:TRZ/ATZ family hydrolase [Alcanivorax sp. 1008]|uniref:TRZ/ATZ family hydrolase n=1 Tax=Alcanivorax sp. 1008 TaxID=2816853 RepID=UPI001D96E296|nr:TRZ/ATZ family hydrolase [Alcanivorax sp. 1008]MCC1495720.1 TRZ/ATZ family hydrolase [Alcanivorax sp. 1008]
MTAADLIIHARWIIPVEGTGTLNNHAIVVRDGLIADILPSDQVEGRWQAAKVLHLGQHALTPGFVNAHTHSAMNLFRGLADDLPLMTWLEQHIWPAEGKWISDEFVHDGSRFACAEMIRSGTTCFADMYFFPEAIARAAKEAGLRAVLFSPLLDFPTPMAQGPDDYLRLALAAHDNWRHEPLIQIGFGPHAPYTVSDAPLQKLLTYAEELDLPIMMHIHETAGEIMMATADGGARPLDRLHGLGLLGPRLLAVHMTQLTDDEISLLAQTGTSVVHCPESNLKLASGFCPVEKLRNAGVNVALGTDGAASNNDLDMQGEMKTAALLAKAVAQDAAALPAAAALEMATLAGARALGIDSQTGSLVIGKQADIIAFDLGAVETQPLYDPVAQIVYSASRAQISHTFVAGRALMENRVLTTLNEARVLRDARAWGDRIRGESA